MSLWLALNVLVKDRFKNVTRDRDLIEKLKNIDDSLYSDFFKFINDSGESENTRSIIFKGYFSGLYYALESAEIKKNRGEGIISFNNAVLESNNGSPKYHLVIKKKEDEYEDEDEDKIEISPNLYIDSNDNNVFKAYIEVLYQVRCTLFHGDLISSSDNEKVIRFSYLTLQMLMKDV